MNCIRVHQEPLWCKKSFIGFFHSGKPSSSCGSAWFWGCGWGQDASHQALPAEQSGGMLPELSSSFPGEHFKCPSPGGVKDAPFIWPKSKDRGSHYFCFHFYFVLFGLIFTLLFVIIQASRPENNPHNQILICTSTKTPSIQSQQEAHHTVGSDGETLSQDTKQKLLSDRKQFHWWRAGQCSQFPNCSLQAMYSIPTSASCSTTTEMHVIISF